MLGKIVDDWLAINISPEIIREAAKLLLHRHKQFGVIDSRADFLPIADNRTIGQQPGYLAVAVGSYTRRVKTFKCTTVAVAATQYSNPREARLSTL